MVWSDARDAEATTTGLMRHDEPVSSDDHEEVGRPPTWLLIGLAAASLAGLTIGLVATPSLRRFLTLATLVQLAVTGAGVIMCRRPVLWAVLVAAACLVSTVGNADLAALAHMGGVPWLGLASTTAAWGVVRHAQDRTSLAAGAAALLLGQSGVVASAIRAGLPPTPAVVSSTVPLLVGVVIALGNRLQDARNDRLAQRAGMWLSAPSGTVDEVSDAGAGVPLADARRALAVVALRADDLVAQSPDPGVRRTAADLREVARRGLTGKHSSSAVIIELKAPAGPVEAPAAHSATAAPTGGQPVRVTTPMPDLSERDREVLRLVSTGASNATIARTLYLSEATVKQYVSKLMRRFERDNRTQLALMAARWFEEDTAPTDESTR